MYSEAGGEMVWTSDILELHSALGCLIPVTPAVRHNP